MNAARSHIRSVSSTDALPPHDLDAEAAVIATMILEPNAIDVVIEVLGGLDDQPGDHKPHRCFYSDANARIVTAVLATYALDPNAFDEVAVVSYLRDRDWMQQVTAPYLADIVDKTPSVHHVRAHAEIVFDHWRMREALALSQRLAVEARNAPCSSNGQSLPEDPRKAIMQVTDGRQARQEFLERAARSFEELAGMQSGARVPSMREGVSEANEVLNQIRGRAGQALGYSTGWRGLDLLISGLVPQELTLLSARNKRPDGSYATTGVGKSTFARELGLNVVRTPYRWFDKERVEHEEKIGVLLFTLEMKRSEVTLQLACRMAGLEWKEIKSGRHVDPMYGSFAPEIERRLNAALEELQSLPFLIEDARPLTVARARRRILAAREQLRREGVKLGLVIFDRIGLMKPSRPGRERSAADDLNHIGEELRGLSLDKRIPGVHYAALLQVKADRVPQNCSALENHANNFLINEFEEERGRDEISGVIYPKKTRDGRRGDDHVVPMLFDKRTTTYREG